MEIYSNYIETARRMKSDQSRGEFFNAIIWFVEDGIEPEFKSEAAECSFQAILPSLLKQRQRVEAGRASAAKRTEERKANETGNEKPTNQATSGATNEEQANKLISYQANKLSSIDSPIAPYSDVINYLNEKTGKNFRSSSAASQRYIKARFNEGYSLDDFKAVIDNMVSRWADDAKMRQYLRPETLFGTKFESYLNNKPIEVVNADFGIYANVI